MYENSSIFEKNDDFDGHVEMCYAKCYSAISELYISRSGLRQDGTFGLIDDQTLSYDDNGNPAGIQFANGSATDYVYTATGQKLRVIYYTVMPSVQVGAGGDFGSASRPCLSADSIDYLFGGNVLCRNGRVSQILFDGGYVKVGCGRSRAA